MDLEFLNTLGRGTLLIRADDENDLFMVNQYIEDARLIKDMTFSQKRAFLKERVRKGIGVNTFEVSYVGRVPWSGLDRYIRRFSPYIDLTLSGGLSLEVFSLGDYFTVTIMQGNSDDKYIKHFIELLADQGISCEQDPPEHFELSGFETN